ncbi:hypothetical protein [Rhodococcus rhodochrous]|uniref:hypothetical protein n=1 Tax=Rhodococcus rhodochrous TaxID=1829 RepID=UPI001781176C|nr:hypothetical protein [Rhodococcus rhodochrous]
MSKQSQDTPLNADDELRNRIYNEVKLWMTPNESLRFIDDFMPIILADRKKHALQAGISELEAAADSLRSFGVKELIDGRIAELERQQTEAMKGENV